MSGGEEASLTDAGEPPGPPDGAGGPGGPGPGGPAGPRGDLPGVGGHHAVTGAFGFSGRRIARRLLDDGHRVTTLTGHPGRGAGRLATRLEAIHPFRFGAPDRMAGALEGVDVLHNTYWIRFERGERTFRRAVRNSRRLFEAAAAAGVERIVHVSIAHPGARDDLPYYRGKARVEEALADTGVPHSVLRPALLFGEGDVLVNNIAWIVRRLPVFAVPGRGDYRVRPIHVDDLAALAVREADRDEDRRVVPAVGPDRPRYREMVRRLADALGERVRVVGAPPAAVLAAAKALGLLVRDVVLTRDELEGLTAGLLDVEGEAAGETGLFDWVADDADAVGRSWASELERHYR